MAVGSCRLMFGCALWAIQANSRQPHTAHSLCVCKRALGPAYATPASNEQGTVAALVMQPCCFCLLHTSTHPSIVLFIHHSLLRSFVRSFIHSFIRSFIHSSTRSFSALGRLWHHAPLPFAVKHIVDYTPIHSAMQLTVHVTALSNTTTYCKSCCCLACVWPLEKGIVATAGGGDHQVLPAVV